MRLRASLVDAGEHDEAVHEQQPKATPAHPEDQQADPQLPAQPRPKQKVPQAALAQQAPRSIAASARPVADQRADAARRLIVVVLVLALHGAATARIRARAATANVDERDRGLQLRLRVLRRVAPPRLHLRVVLYVGVVRVIERAGAVVASLLVAVCALVAAVRGQLHGGAREGAEEVERLSEGVLGAAVEAQRVHAGRCMAGDAARRGMAVRNERRKLVQGAQGGAVAARCASPSSVGPCFSSGVAVLYPTSHDAHLSGRHASPA